MQIGDPTASNYGRANYGQLAPNRTAQLRQQSNQQPAQQSPMLGALNQAPQQPAQVNLPQPTKPTAATGTFGPRQFTQGLQNRGQTDFSKSPTKLDGAQNLMQKATFSTGFLSPFGIGRRAKGSENDLSVDNAKIGLQRAYQGILGRDASEDELMSQLQGQGLKPGDRWVGQRGFDSIVNSLQPDPVAQAGGKQVGTAVADNFSTGQLSPQNFNIERNPMMGALQANPAAQAYQEYLSEFGPEDMEQPVPFEQFSQLFSQLPQGAMTESLWNPETREAVVNDAGRFGWNNINLNPVNQLGGSRFEGFNDERALAGEDTKSIKDTFRRVVGGLGVDLSQFRTFEDVENMLRTQVAPALQQAGVNVLDVQKDKILVETFERGPEWVDVVGDATGNDPRWWWGDEGGATQLGGQMGPIDPMSFLNAEGDRRSLDTEPAGQQGQLLNALGFGGDWQSLLDMLMQQVK